MKRTASFKEMTWLAYNQRKFWMAEIWQTGGHVGARENVGPTIQLSRDGILRCWISPIKFLVHPIKLFLLLKETNTATPYGKL